VWTERVSDILSSSDDCGKPATPWVQQCRFPMLALATACTWMGTGVGGHLQTTNSATLLLESNYSDSILYACNHGLV
jgi:hypothetical protein